MDEFILPIDINKFRSTNQAWNDLKLNNPWSVGYVTSLIVKQKFSKKDEWETFFYQSGTLRNTQLQQLSREEQDLLNDEQLILKGESKINQLSYTLKNLNYQFGRTEDQLRQKGTILYGAVKNNGYGLTNEDCFQCTRFRVICETWNGVALEVNIIATLKIKRPHLEFSKTDGPFDYKYAVDYQVYQDGKLICGLQIKPESYLSDISYINKARFANKQKNGLYTKDFGAPVYDVIGNIEGRIIKTTKNR